MIKAVLQAFAIVALFLLIWFVLAKIDFVAIFKVQEATDKTEERLSDLFLETFRKTERENKNPFIVNTVDSIVTKVCHANRIDRESIKVHILDVDEVNAFALPNGHLLIFSGLILSAENQEELSGVICHEIAHIQLNHVMRKLVKEVGLSVLISMTTGHAGTEIIKETLKILTSSTYDRSLEKEADITAVDYLIKAKINPEPFADFLYKLSKKENEMTKYLSWFSTHPESEDRAAYIIEYSADKKTDYEPILKAETWIKLKEELTE